MSEGDIMRTWTLAALVGLALSNPAQAQFGLFSRPTQAVGSPVGTPVGSPVVTTPSPFGSTMQPIGTPINPSLSVAPVAGNPAGDSFFSRFYNRLASIVPFSSKANTGTTGWFPSLGRRNRERHKAQAMPVWLLD